jgi:hypothetical protein
MEGTIHVTGAACGSRLQQNALQDEALAECAALCEELGGTIIGDPDCVVENVDTCDDPETVAMTPVPDEFASAK